jgi:hypothetical protein
MPSPPLVININLVPPTPPGQILNTPWGAVPNPPPSWVVTPIPLPSPTASRSVTPTPTPEAYVTVNVNEFETYTLYRKRDLWEQAVASDVFIEDFEGDNTGYGGLPLPYLTPIGFFLEGNSSIQFIRNPSLLTSGNYIHFRNWEGGLTITFPAETTVSAFAFDHKAAEDWQLTFHDSVVTIPGGRGGFVGIVLHQDPVTEFVLSSSERVQGGLAIDNLSYVPAN